MSATDPTEISKDIPNWLEERLYNIALTQPRYEASFNGPHSTMLQCFFPAEHCFMVKPICRIRPAINPFSDPNDDDSMNEAPPTRVSIDSNRSMRSNRRSVDSSHSMQSNPFSDRMSIEIKTDSSESFRPSDDEDSESAVAGPNTHVSRDSYNRAVSKGNSHGAPDMLVVKASGQLNNDRALLIWELKRNAKKHTEAIAQRDRYESWAKDYQHYRLDEDGTMPSITVALVEHDDVTIRILSGNGQTEEVELGVRSEDVRAMLRKIARDNA